MLIAVKRCCLTKELFFCASLTCKMGRCSAASFVTLQVGKRLMCREAQTCGVLSKLAYCKARSLHPHLRALPGQKRWRVSPGMMSLGLGRSRRVRGDRMDRTPYESCRGT